MGGAYVEKIIRMTEVRAARRCCRSSGSSTPPAPDHRPDRSLPGAGAAPDGSFRNQSPCRARCRRSACLFGPSAAGGAYIPSFCDLVIWSRPMPRCISGPRGWPDGVGEHVTLEEMGGAGCTPRYPAAVINWRPTKSRRSTGQAVLRLSAADWRSPLPRFDGAEPAIDFTADLGGRPRTSAGYDIHTVIDALVDEGRSSVEANVRAGAGSPGSVCWMAK